MDLREVIEDSVDSHLVADVPVSSFLSGGLDSSIVTVLAKQANPQVDAYTITFRAQDQRLEAMPDDAVYARKVAQRYGIKLHEIELTARRGRPPAQNGGRPRRADRRSGRHQHAAHVGGGSGRRGQSHFVGDGGGRVLRGLPQAPRLRLGRAVPGAPFIRPPLDERRRRTVCR